MDAIFQTAFSIAFCWMKIYAFRLKFQWNLFLSAQITIPLHWVRWWLCAGQATSRCLNYFWFTDAYLNCMMSQQFHPAIDSSLVFLAIGSIRSFDFAACISQTLEWRKQFSSRYKNNIRLNENIWVEQRWYRWLYFLWLDINQFKLHTTRNHIRDMLICTKLLYRNSFCKFSTVKSLI